MAWRPPMATLSKNSVKRFLASYFPPLLTGMQACRPAMKGWRERRIARHIDAFRQSFSDRCAWTVQHGPLAGLRYRPSSRSDSLLPRLVGSYEAEIHGFIENALKRRPSVLIDIGCEEGY